MVLLQPMQWVGRVGIREGGNATGLGRTIGVTACGDWHGHVAPARKSASATSVERLHKPQTMVGIGNSRRQRHIFGRNPGRGKRKPACASFKETTP
jgi:hypothetical protein